MIYVVDIDGTLGSFTDENIRDYTNAYPLTERIEKINKLYDDGHYIKLFTARGMRRNKDNVAKAYDMFYSLTKKQLAEWGVKYHELIMGKPSCDIFIDDKAINDKDFFKDG